MREEDDEQRRGRAEKAANDAFRQKRPFDERFGRAEIFHNRQFFFAGVQGEFNRIGNNENDRAKKECAEKHAEKFEHVHHGCQIFQPRLPVLHVRE